MSAAASIDKTARIWSFDTANIRALAVVDRGRANNNVTTPGDKTKDNTTVHYNSKKCPFAYIYQNVLNVC